MSDTEIATRDEMKNAKDEISSLRKTIENMKRSVPNEQMIDQIIKDEVTQRIEDLKYSYKTDLKLLKESFDDKLNELTTEYNKLKHEKLSLEGKINTLTGSCRSLEQENKALKDTISALSENLHEQVTNFEVNIVIKDIANIQDELGSLDKLIESNSISPKQELDVLTMKVSDNRSHDQSVKGSDNGRSLQSTPNDRISNESSVESTENGHSEQSAQAKSEMNYDFVALMDSNRKYINIHKLAHGKNKRIFPCGNIQKAKETLETANFKTKILLLHFGVNDIEETQNSQSIAKNLLDVCELASNKFPAAKIFVSEITPRQDDLQPVVEEVNSMFRNQVTEIKNCTIINHTNLNDKGLFFDRKHLSRSKGIPLLAKNIKSSFRSSHAYNKIMKRNTHLNGTRNTPRYVSKHHDAQYNQMQGANDDDKQGNKLVGNSTFPVKELSETITNNMMNLM